MSGSGSDRDIGRKSRWWLDPALARLAFGTESRGQNDGSGTALSGLLPHGPWPHGLLSLDLDDPAQREFGDYELLECIGQGGMGVVFRARQLDLDREIAIKLLAAGLEAPEDVIEILRREARHAAMLQHPNIVIVHELGEYAGLIYYAMQLVPGRSLSQQLQADIRSEPTRAATLLRTLAEAVGYAHRLGVLHLDLKPGNILIDEHGEPLIADFGLARTIEHATEHPQVAGTPSYMAPNKPVPTVRR